MNLKVRFNNPIFWAQLALSIALPILAYYNIQVENIDTWSGLFEILGSALRNPYLFFTVVVSVWNAFTDPTTKGLGDSGRAMTYTTPAE